MDQDDNSKSSIFSLTFSSKPIFFQTKKKFPDFPWLSLTMLKTPIFSLTFPDCTNPVHYLQIFWKLAHASTKFGQGFPLTFFFAPSFKSKSDEKKRQIFWLALLLLLLLLLSVAVVALNLYIIMNDATGLWKNLPTQNPGHDHVADWVSMDATYLHIYKLLT